MTIQGKVTMANGVYEVQVSGGTTAASDRLVVGGSFTCGGKLYVKQINSPLFSAGQSVQIISADTIMGRFNTIELPVLTDGLSWDTTSLYKDGRLTITTLGSILQPVVQSGVLQNPTNGLFLIQLKQPVNKLTINVLNLKGRLIFASEEESLDNSYSIDLRNQPDGLYLLKLVAEDHLIGLLKLVKK
jgi:hypothetical protein